MNRIFFLKTFLDLFEFKIIEDENGNEYVVFSKSGIKSIKSVMDKTEFEAIENHVHLYDNINLTEFEELKHIANKLGKLLLCNLKQQFPKKNFTVYVTISLHESMIIRFHQNWKDELPYYDPDSYNSDIEKVFMFVD